MTTGRLDVWRGTASLAVSTPTLHISIFYYGRSIFQEIPGFAFFWVDADKNHQGINSPPVSVAGIPRQFLREDKRKIYHTGSHGGIQAARRKHPVFIIESICMKWAIQEDRRGVIPPQDGLPAPGVSDATQPSPHAE